MSIVLSRRAAGVSAQRRTLLATSALTAATALMLATPGGARAQDVTLDGTDATYEGVQTFGTLIVGQNQNASATFQNAAEATADDVIMGQNSGSNGTVSVTGSSTLTISNGLTVGQDGTGYLAITAGGGVSAAGFAVIGEAAEGIVDLQGAGSRLDVGALTVAGNSQSFIFVQGGADGSSGNTVLGRDQFSYGSLELYGAGATWITTGALTVGSVGSGLVYVEGGGAFTAQSMLLGAFAEGSGTLQVESGGVVDVFGGLTIGAAGIGTGFLSGAGSQINTQVSLVIGDEGDGSLSILNGGVLTSTSDASVGVSVGSSGTVTVGGVGSRFDIDGNLVMADAGTGSMTISAGGVVDITGTMRMNGATTSVSRTTVTGAGSLLDVGGASLSVGQSGDADLVIANDGMVTVADGLGFVQLSELSTATTANTVTIGALTGSAAVAAGVLDAAEVRFGAGPNEAVVFNHTDTDYVFAPLITGAGALNHFAGQTTLTADNTYTGLSNVHGGTLTLTGDSTNTGTGYRIGLVNGDNGALIVSGGGSGVSTSMGIGLVAGSTGAVTITGAGSSWQTTIGALQIGLGGNGTLTIADGGVMTNGGFSIIGNDAGASGSVTVTGADSVWNIPELYVGSTGAGALTISAGGVVNSTTGYAGSGPGSGTATITGADSLWSNSGDFYIAFNGTGSVRVADGGTLTVGGGTGVVRVTNTLAGANGSVTIGGAVGQAAEAGGVLDARIIQFGAGTGSLNFNHTDTAQGFVLNIRGAGAVNHYAGTTILTSNNTYTGATTITGGTLFIDGASNQGTGAYSIAATTGTSGALIIRDGGRLTNGATTIGYNGGFFGSSAGAATVTGNGTSWITASITMQAGSLTIADNAVLTVGSGTGSISAGNPGMFMPPMGFFGATTGAINIGAADGSAAAAAGVLNAGTLSLASGGAGRLVFNHTETAYDFDTAIAGGGAILQRAGATTLSASSAGFSGSTTVSGGSLTVEGALGGAVSVTGGVLGGTGSVGAASITTGTLAGEAGSVLTLASLSLTTGSTVAVTLGAPSEDALFDVTGNLTLDGTLDINSTLDFGEGLYRLFDYGGDLTDNGLEIGDVPAGFLAEDMAIQTSQAGRVNLLNGAELLFWDGSEIDFMANGVVDGGDGTWTTVSQTWTDMDGLEAGAMRPQPGFGVFMGAPGVVTIDNTDGAVTATGLQFAVDGYVVDGDVLTLIEPALGEGVTIRVGDGTADGADMTATINADIDSAHSFFKTDRGELVLTGEATFGGFSNVRGGTLTIADGGLLDLNGDIQIGREDGDDATLRVIGGGTVDINGAGSTGALFGSFGSAEVSGAGSTWTNNGDLSIGLFGSGELTISDGGLVNSRNGYIGRFREADGGPQSDGVATVTGANSVWADTNQITVGGEGHGQLRVQNGGQVQVVDLNGPGVIHIARENQSTGVLSIGGGQGEVAQAAGFIVASEIRFGDGTGQVDFNHTDEDYVFASRITGAGDVLVSSGYTTLTGFNTYTGTTTVNGGTLEIARDANNGAGEYHIGGQADSTGAIVLLEAAVTSGAVFVGFAPDATGLLTIDGSTWYATTMVVGYEGAGTLSVVNAGYVDAPEFIVGGLAGASGVATFDGDALLEASQSVIVGYFAEGEMTVSNGATVMTALSAVGGAFDGALTLQTDAQWINTGVFNVGLMVGDGVVTIESGADLTSASGILGVTADSSGEVLVTGAGSTWTNTAGLTVGEDGGGMLTIADGGVVSSDFGLVGADGGTGAVLVTGAGSQWTLADFLQLTLGSIVVADGGFVSGVYGILAGGSAQITGQDSVWEATDSFEVGGSQDASLVLTDGGTLSTPSLVIGRFNGGNGQLFIGSDDLSAPAAAGFVDADFVTIDNEDSALIFNHTDTDYVFASAISGSGFIDHLAGVTTLTADSAAFTGPTTVSGGTLFVDGTVGSSVSVLDGGSLGGTGTIGSAVVTDGGTLLGQSGQTLTMGSLALSDASNVNVTLGAPSTDGLFDVTGDLVLDGVLNVTAGGDFGAGVYRLFDYGGDLTDNGLDIGMAPAGTQMGDLEVQTAVDGQVNLISAAGAELLFWDGGNAALYGNGAVDGGTGTWVSGGDAWTTANGGTNGPYRPNPGFAVFQGTAGTVTVSGDDIGVTGMQFAVDGYAVEGDAIDLTEALTAVRVGDGTAAGADMTATIAASLTGVGTLVKMDLGTLILTGANSYAGGVQVRDGVLIGDTASLIGDIDNDATLVFDQGADADYAGAISGDGETIKRGDGVLTLTGANTVDWAVETGGLSVGAAAFGGDVDVAAGASFAFGPVAEATWSGVLTGDGDFAKQGGTTLTLTGDSSAFDGVTTVEAGSLFVNGALGGETVILDGGFIGGSGAIGQLTIADGAVVSPGNSIGTLDVNGDLVFAAGSTYEVEVDPMGTASDLIAVTGTVTIEGGTVRHIGFDGDYGPSSRYEIITAGGGVTGTFDTVETDFAFLDATLGYEADAVFLSLDRNQVAFPTVGQTDNQRAAGAGIESTGMGADLYDAVVGLSADQARLAFDQLSGELHGSVRTSLIEDATWIRGVAQQRTRAFDPAATGLQMWAQAHGAVGRLGTDDNAASLRSQSGGVWVGADAAVLPGLMLGVAGGADRAEYDADSRSGEGERDGYRLAAYGSGQWGAFGLSAGVSGAWDDIETTRTPTFSGFSERLEADYSAETMQAFAEATWSIPAGQAVFQPFANVARVSTKTDGFTETGGDGALTVDGQTQDVTFATLGLGASRAWDRADGRSASLGGRIGWRTASGDLSSDNSQAFAGGTAFTVEGLPVEDDVLVAEIGAAIQVREALAVTVDWTAQAGDRTTAQRLSAGLRWRF